MARLGLFAAGAWLNAALRFYSHETAHEYVYRHKNLAIDSGLDFLHWKSTTIPGFFYPAWKQSPLDPALLADDELILATVGGLNQDEINAARNWRAVSDRGVLSFYDSQAYLLTKLRDVQYILQSGSDERPFAPGMRTDQLHRAVAVRTPHLYDDVNLYRLALLNNGFDITNDQLLKRSLLADALSWRTWESFYALFAYLFRGRAAVPVVSFRRYGLAITPPLISHYLMTDGSYFNVSLDAAVGEHRLNFAFGAVIGFDASQKQGVRFGVASGAVHLTDRWATAPFLFLNRRRQKFSGISLGLRNSLLLTQRLSLLVDFEYNRNDILQNGVQLKKDGFYSTIGLRTTL